MAQCSRLRGSSSGALSFVRLTSSCLASGVHLRHGFEFLSLDAGSAQTALCWWWWLQVHTVVVFSFVVSHTSFLHRCAQFLLTLSVRALTLLFVIFSISFLRSFSSFFSCSHHLNCFVPCTLMPPAINRRDTRLNIPLSNLLEF